VRVVYIRSKFDLELKNEMIIVLRLKILVLLQEEFHCIYSSYIIFIEFLDFFLSFLFNMFATIVYIVLL
jgi:hypothetical protein